MWKMIWFVIRNNIIILWTKITFIIAFEMMKNMTDAKLLRNFEIVVLFCCKKSINIQIGGVIDEQLKFNFPNYMRFENIMWTFIKPNIECCAMILILLFNVLTFDLFSINHECSNCGSYCLDRKQLWSCVTLWSCRYHHLLNSGWYHVFKMETTAVLSKQQPQPQHKHIHTITYQLDKITNSHFDSTTNRKIRQHKNDNEPAQIICNLAIYRNDFPKEQMSMILEVKSTHTWQLLGIFWNSENKNNSKHIKL